MGPFKLLEKLKVDKSPGPDGIQIRVLFEIKNQIEEVEKEKDLGIVFDNQLHFEQHVSDCTSKARQRIGLIKRNFKYLDERTFLTLYKSLIRPLLEYGNTVWKPYYKKDSEALEKVQRRATKLVPRIKDLPYPSRLKVLQLPTLIYRRMRADMLQVYRILTGMDKVEVNRFFKLEGDGNRKSIGINCLNQE